MITFYSGNENKNKEKKNQKWQRKKTWSINALVDWGLWKVIYGFYRIEPNHIRFFFAEKIQFKGIFPI